MSKPDDLKKALAEAAEEKSWSCQSCGNMLEPSEEKPYCRTCRQYWDDVAAGVFDR